MALLDLDLLRTFIAVSEGSSFVAAAERVHRTQSAVTQRMQKLERQIGTPLFEKSGRNKQLTAQGLRLLHYARRILALNDEILDSLAAPDLKGPLRIGTPHDTSQFLLPNLLSQFAELYPNLQIEMVTDRTAYLMRALKKGDIEATVAGGWESPPDPDHPSVRLRTSSMVWMCAADYVYDRTQPVSLVLPDEPSGYRKAAIQALDASNIKWRLRHVVKSLAFEGVHAAVRARLGITVRLLEMLSRDLRTLGAADGLPKLPDTSYYLYLRDEHASLPARRLFELVGKATIQRSMLGRPRKLRG